MYRKTYYGIGPWFYSFDIKDLICLVKSLNIYLLKMMNYEWRDIEYTKILYFKGVNYFEEYDWIL